ncbi:hypothetical protein ACFGVR_14865 [Mucilaginibacter sp. AW1-3]
MKNPGSISSLLSKKTHWVVRWGITIYFFIFIIIVFALKLFYYPSYLVAQFQTFTVPGQSETLYAEIRIPSDLANKISSNLPLNLKYDTARYKEYGILRGKIIQIFKNDRKAATITCVVSSERQKVNAPPFKTFKMSGTTELILKQKTYFDKFAEMFK